MRFADIEECAALAMAEAELAPKLTSEVREASAAWMVRLVETSVAHGKLPKKPEAAGWKRKTPAGAAGVPTSPVEGARVRRR